MRWASSSAACTRASTVWPASAARTPSSACPAPACMRRSRSMDALNGAIQCDSTSVSLDSPSSLFKVSAVTRSTRSPSASAWSLDRRSGAGSGGAGGGSPGRCSGGRKSDGRGSRGGAGDASGGRRCSGARPAGRSPRPARRRAWPRAAADPCPAAARRYRWPAGAAGLPAPPPGSLPSRARCAPPDAGRRCAPPLERMRRAHAGFQLRGRGRVVLQRQQAVVQHLHLRVSSWNSSSRDASRIWSGFTPDSVPKPASAGFHPGRPRCGRRSVTPREYFRLAPATVAGKGSSRSRSTE